MRTPEENRAYMSKYMHNKYAENIEASRAKSIENYYRNKHSCLNQQRKIDKLIDKLYVEITALMEHNADSCQNELDSTRSQLTELLNNIAEPK